MLKLIVSVPYAPTATTSALTSALLLADVIASRKVTKTIHRDRVSRVRDRDGRCFSDRPHCGKREEAAKELCDGLYVEN